MNHAYQRHLFVRINNMTEKDERSHPRSSQAYLVRIWRSGSESRWYFSVQDVASGERHGFPDLDGFVTYFYTMIRDQPFLDEERRHRSAGADVMGPREAEE